MKPINKLLCPILAMLLLSLTVAQSSAQIANTISSNDKVLGLSTFWQEVNYNFVYFNKIGHHTWDSAYKAMIPQVQASSNDYEYYKLLQKFCALLKDGHTEVFMPPIKGANYIYNMFGDHLLVLKMVDNKIIIKRTWKKDLQQFPLGSEIIEVNDMSTWQYVNDSVAPFISSSTDFVRRDIAGSSLLAGFSGSTFKIKIRKPGGEQAVYTLTHEKTTDSVFAPEPGEYADEKQRDLLDFKMYDKGIAYVALNSFGNARIDTLFEKLLPSLYTSKAVIIDLRNNGGGDDGVAFNILKYFIQDSIMKGAAAVSRIQDPYQKAIGAYIKPLDTAGNAQKKDAWLLYHGYAVYNEPGIVTSQIAPGLKRITAPVVLLTGSNTESAAEDFVIAAYNQKHIIRIGEPTNGSTGQPYLFDLPGGGRARICVIKNTFADGREFVGYGIQPDIKIAPSVKDYLENKDTALQAALQYFAKKGNNK